MADGDDPTSGPQASSIGSPSRGQDWLSPKEAAEVATDAYVYGYSLITTKVTRVRLCNDAKSSAWPGEWANSSTPNATRRHGIAEIRSQRRHLVFGRLTRPA